MTDLEPRASGALAAPDDEAPGLPAHTWDQLTLSYLAHAKPSVSLGSMEEPGE
jgi:hypothetical protein